MGEVKAGTVVARGMYIGNTNIGTDDGQLPKYGARGRENSRRKLESGGVCMPYLRFLRDAANSDGGGRDYRVLVLSFDPQDTHRRKWQRNLLG